MSEKITNTFTFYGNNEIYELEREIIKRFKQDREQGTDELTSVKRIFFGLEQKDDFNSLHKTGSHWTRYFGSTKKFELESNEYSLKQLQDHITRHATKIDPDVVIQMEYSDETFTLIGSRFTGISKNGDLLSSVFEQELNYFFCDENDIEITKEELEENGDHDTEVMSHQSLNKLMDLLNQRAKNDFCIISGRDPISISLI